MQVKIFSSSGELLRAMGRAGGRRPGVYQSEDFYLPSGLAIDACAGVCG